MEHDASAEHIRRNDGRVSAMQSAGLYFALSFCPAHLHLHSNAVLDLELDLWCPHAVNMMQSIIFTDAADHLQL